MFPFFGSIGAIATGWTGNINFLGVIVPNWVAVILAIALAVIGWLRSNSVDIKPKLPFWLALCGAGHAFFFIVSVFMAGPAQLGLGSVATLVSFIAPSQKGQHHFIHNIRQLQGVNRAFYQGN
jgi:hypothetical protein